MIKPWKTMTPVLSKLRLNILAPFSNSSIDKKPQNSNRILECRNCKVKVIWSKWIENGSKDKAQKIPVNSATMWLPMRISKKLNAKLWFLEEWTPRNWETWKHLTQTSLRLAKTLPNCLHLSELRTKPQQNLEIGHTRGYSSTSTINISQDEVDQFLPYFFTHRFSSWDAIGIFV